MEDASVMGTLDSGTRYYAVLDGHGGEEVARFARDHLFGHLRGFSSHPSQEQITEAFILTDRCLQTHGEELLNCSRSSKKKRSSCFSGQMLEMRRDHPEMSIQEITATLIAHNAGAVASVAFVSGRNLTVATLGDCQAFLVRRTPEGDLQIVDLQSRVHQLDDEEESSRVRSAGLDVFGEPLRIQGSLAVSRAIGDLRFKFQEHDGVLLPAEAQPVSVVPEIIEHVLTENDEYIFLGCDGIFEVLTPRQIADYLCEAPDDIAGLLDSCLAATANETIGKDNMSAVLAHLRLD
jgi:serine/threonine protein phosphatase PrpC